MKAMMIAAVPTVAAAWAYTAETPRAARTRSIAGMALAGTLAVVWAGWRLNHPVQGDPLENWAVVLPAFISAIGLVAVAMGGLHEGTQGTFSRILLVVAMSLAMVRVGEPVAVLALWCLLPLPVWWELRASPANHATARVFAAYMLPATLLAVAGAGFIWRGMPHAALVPIAAALVVREAILPAHSWFPALAERAPLGLVVAFVAPQMGVYVHLRAVSGILGPANSTTVAVLGAITAVMAAAMGMVQVRARRSMAYLIISQSGLVAFGLESGSAVGRTGGLVVWFVAGLAVAGFAMSICALEARRGPLRMDRPTGSFARIPRLASAFLVLGLACVGLPGTLGFVAEDLLSQGSVETSPALGFALVVATACNGVTVMRAFTKLFTGTSDHAGEVDLTRREGAVLGVLLAALFVAGVWPAAVLPALSLHG